MEHGLVLTWAAVSTVLMLILMIAVIGLRGRHRAYVARVEEALEQKQKALETKQTKSHRLGQSTIRGELNQILGQFAILNEYERLASVSSVSSQFSLDLLGIKEDSVDFIEVKSSKTPLSPNERKVKKLIDAKKVRYRVIEANLPKSFEMTDRPDGSRTGNDPAPSSSSAYRAALTGWRRAGETHDPAGEE